MSNETSNEIHFVGTTAAAIVGKVPVPANPRGMRFTADSRHLYVASERTKEISILDVQARKLIKSASIGGVRPVDLVLCPEERQLYVSHGGSGDIRVFDAKTLNLSVPYPWDHGHGGWHLRGSVKIRRLTA